jgi:AcrR family transcriptional regulator
MAAENKKQDKREAILNAAENLFAKHGYDGVTLRAIAKEAGVDVALANYHFGPKRDLFDAVLLRRAQILNSWRLEALEATVQKAAPNPPEVKDIIRAYFEPLFKRSQVQEPGWKSYYALIAYVNSSPEWGGTLMTQFFDPMIHRFLAVLKTALPGVPDKSVYWGYHCLSGALTLAFAQTGRIDHLSNDLCKSDDLPDACDYIVDFVAAGFSDMIAASEKETATL